MGGLPPMPDYITEPTYGGWSPMWSERKTTVTTTFAGEQDGLLTIECEIGDVDTTPEAAPGIAPKPPPAPSNESIFSLEQLTDDEQYWVSVGLGVIGLTAWCNFWWWLSVTVG